MTGQAERGVPARVSLLRSPASKNVNPGTVHSFILLTPLSGGRPRAAAPSWRGVRTDA